VKRVFWGNKGFRGVVGLQALTASPLKLLDNTHQSMFLKKSGKKNGRSLKRPFLFSGD
jgi:hypothetical protein